MVHHGPLPSARREGVVVRELLDETIVYDRERQRAHCLSPLAARIWRACDGKTSAAEIAACLRRETGRGVDEDVVSLTLLRLARAHLLEPAPTPERPRRTRRDWLRKAAALGGLSVFSIAVPAAAQVGTCIPDSMCATTPGPPCPGLPCCSNPSLRCKNDPGNRACVCR